MYCHLRDGQEFNSRTDLESFLGWGDGGCSWSSESESKEWRKRMRKCVWGWGADHMQSFVGSSETFGLFPGTERSHREVGSDVSFRKGTENVVILPSKCS